ncbi:MAG: hypothetical protein JWQ35_2311, partial [Bacteriovoracaceae bacterium]|nr:hypothetical protein [Bacteriovoracaceae bacterium]
MKKNLHLLPFIFLLVGCSAAVNSSATNTLGGSVTTTFQNPTNLQIAAIPGAGIASQLLIGNFNGDTFPDII